MNQMLKMIQVAAERAEWSGQISIEWDAADTEANPVSTIRIADAGDDCVFTFGPQSAPFSTDWDIQIGNGSLLTVSAEATMTAIEFWLTSHKNASN